MDDETRKMMTEWLGEKWKLVTHNGKIVPMGNRSFAAPDDFFAVKSRLAETGDLVDFLNYSAKEYLAEKLACGVGDACEIYWGWLIDPARFCQLCADFLKGRE